MTNTTKMEAIVFEAAMAVDNVDQRRAIIEAACRDNQDLLKRVEDLLAANSGVDSFMQQPAVQFSDETLDKQPTEKPGTTIGRYKLLEQIGEGGFGVVYMADQLRPIERRVALKIIKLGMDTKQVIARFEAERQALALMDHPNIAKILDAGATEAGRPYFVMELVRGIPVTEYCDDRNLSTQQRLKLFTQICYAVQHAHQKGIIHRDIKPNNVLVATDGDEAVPKVIDFGIAKATQGRLTDKTLFTQFRQFIGTPIYMSPEQAQMSAVDVDTRSDIYSLGVLLYELMTGSTPLDTTELANAGHEEICRRIRQEEAIKPSKRLSSLQHGELSTLAKQRNTAVSQFTTSIRGDLDWIVMKAVEKDRARRYESCGAFADDILRYLDQKPVAAAPPSAAYQLKKFWSRNRTLLTTVAAISGILLVSTIALAYMYVQQSGLYQQQRVLLDTVKERELEADNQRRMALTTLNRSLIGEARAIRLARQPGYREEAQKRLQQAISLEIPEPTLEDIRREAVLQMGDYYGTASTWGPEQRIVCVAVHPNRAEVAVALGDGSLSIRRLPDCEEISSLCADGDRVRELRFQPDGRSLYCLRASKDGVTQVELWRTEGTDAWDLDRFIELDGEAEGIDVSSRDTVAAISLVSSEGQAQLVFWPENSKPKIHMLSDSGCVGPVTFSPDGRRLVLAHETNVQIRGPSAFSVWDVDANKIIRSNIGSQLDGITALEFDPSGELLGCAAHAGVDIYRVDSFSPIMRAEGLSNSRSVCFDRLGQNFTIINDQENRAVTWDIASGQAKAVLPHLNEPQSVGKTKNGECLVVWGRRAMRVWEKAGTREKTIYAEFGVGVPGMAYSPSGTLLATAHKNKLVRIWEVNSRKLIRTLEAPTGPRQAVCFSPDEKLIATSDYDNGSISILDIETGEQLRQIEHDCGRRLWSIAFSPDGEHFAAAGNGGVHLWRRSTDPDGSPLFELLPAPRFSDTQERRLKYNSRSVCFSPNGKLFGWADGYDPGIHVWDLQTGEKRPSPKGSTFNPIQNMAFLSNNRDVVFITPDRHAEVWNTETGEQIRRFDIAGFGDRTAGSYACKMALSPDNRWLAVSSLTGRSINIWELQTGKLQFSLPEESGSIWRLCWGNDSAHLSASCGSGSIVTWNLDEVSRQLAELGLVGP